MKMTFIFMFASLLGAGLTTSGCKAPREHLESEADRDGGDAQRLVALLDYVGRDYGRAVGDGRVISPEEYEEQLRFTKDARRIAIGLLPSRPSDPLFLRIARIESLVGEKADPAVVASACQAARDEVVAFFGLATSPFDRPHLLRAQALFAEACASCHGASGDADTAQARRLDPAPARFRDSDRLAALSPYRVYNTLTFGISGTAMPSFETLSSSDRWSLAFYVFRLGHEGEPTRPVAMSLSEMASRSDRQILDRLRATSHPSPAAALAHVRHEAAFEEPPLVAGIERTRRLVREALGDLAAGRQADADRRLLDAYLQGFEPLEPRLRARDPMGTRKVEIGFHDLRVAMARGETGTARARAQTLDEELESLTDDRRASVPFFAAFLVFAREGIEAALLVAALLATLRKVGRSEAARFIHLGWIAALPAGVLTWWISETALGLTTARRELIEATVALAAALVLFSVSFWMISKADARRWTAYLRTRLEASLGRQQLAFLAGVAFLAVYREAAETVLFTQALLLEAGGQRTLVWAGAASGLLLVVSIAGFMGRTATRLPLGPFFACSGLLLCALAISFAGSGIYDLVAAGYLLPRPVPFPEIAWLGIHPDLTGLLVQLAIVTTLSVAAFASYRKRPAPTAQKR